MRITRFRNAWWPLPSLPPPPLEQPPFVKHLRINPPLCLFFFSPLLLFCFPLHPHDVPLIKRTSDYGIEVSPCSPQRKLAAIFNPQTEWIHSLRLAGSARTQATIAMANCATLFFLARKILNYIRLQSARVSGKSIGKPQRSNTWISMQRNAVTLPRLRLRHRDRHRRTGITTLPISHFYLI